MAPIESLVQGTDYILENDDDVPYTFVSRLGFGHSGLVEEAKDVFTGEVFARKTIRVRGRNRLEIEKGFKAEVGAIRRLHTHHHFIRVFATYMTKRTFGLVLQPVADSGDLADYLEKYWDLKESTTGLSEEIQEMRQVFEKCFGCLASGLAFMHQKKIRHKDVKPQNILVHQGSLILMDFGYSLDTSSLTNSTTEGRPDALTRRYCAPEVLAHESRNRSSDVWSLGCVFTEVFSSLVQRFTVDDARIFSDEGHIEEIHESLRGLELQDMYSRIPEMLIQMISREATLRPSATVVASGFLLQPGLCCAECWQSKGGFKDEPTGRSPSQSFIPTNDTVPAEVGMTEPRILGSNARPPREHDELALVNSTPTLSISRIEIGTGCPLAESNSESNAGTSDIATSGSSSTEFYSNNAAGWSLRMKPRERETSEALPHNDSSRNIDRTRPPDENSMPHWTWSQEHLRYYHVSQDSYGKLFQREKLQ